MTRGMQTVRFYGGEDGPKTLHIETDGAIFNIQVGLVDAEGRPVTSWQVSPDDETRGGDAHGRIWRLADDGIRVIRQTPLSDDELPQGDTVMNTWSLVTTAEPTDETLEAIAAQVADGQNLGSIQQPREPAR